MEKRAAIETGQEVDRQDINLRGKLNGQSEVLKKAFPFEELNAMQARIQAVIDAERGKSAQAKKYEMTPPDMGSAEGKRPSWRD